MWRSGWLLIVFNCLTKPLEAGAELTYSSFDPSAYYGPMIGPLQGKNRTDYGARSLLIQDRTPSISQLVHIHSKKTGGAPVFSFYNIWDDIMVTETMLRTAYSSIRYNSESKVRKMTLKTMESRYCTNSAVLFQSRVAEALSSHHPLEKLSIYGYATYPGTRSCKVGALNPQISKQAPKYQELESCCRARNKCNIQVYKGKPHKTLSSNTNIRKVACDCDVLFRTCLQDIGDEHARTVGALHYDLFEVNCLRKTSTCYNTKDKEPEPCILNSTSQRLWEDYEWSLGTGPFYSNFKLKSSTQLQPVNVNGSNETDGSKH